MPAQNYLIELLDPTKHDRSSFRCEETVLNTFLQKNARKEAQTRASICYVIVPPDNPTRILGFYTLSNASIRLNDLPPSFTKRLPKYSRIPVTLLGRIARDLSSKGTDVGKVLIMHSLEYAYRASGAVGSTAVVLDPKNPKVAKIYEKLGFKSLRNGQMYLPMKDIANFIDELT